MESPDSVPAWRELTPNEKRVFESAAEREDLFDVYLRWRPWELKRFNGGANNRGGPYVEILIPVALRLLGLGLVEVVGASPDAKLPLLDAADALKNANNWWRYNPQYAADDPEDHGAPPGISSEPFVEGNTYSLVDGDTSAFDSSGWAPSQRMPLVDTD